MQLRTKKSKNPNKLNTILTLLLVITSNLNSALEKEGEENGKISIDVFAIACFFMLIAFVHSSDCNHL